MANNPMIEQINRLIGNLLAEGEPVYLPEVGTLFTEWHAGQSPSRRVLVPPYRTVSFSSQQRGTSLVDAIADVVKNADALRGVNTAPFDAQALYNEWLASVQSDKNLLIEGIGLLKFKNFKLTEEFEKRLNPQGRTPMKLKRKRRFDWALWLGILAILVAAGFGGYEFLMMQPDTPQPTVVPAPAPAPAPVDSAAMRAADSLAKADSIAKVRAAQTSALEAPADMESGLRYVVLGVYSTFENAVRGAKTAADKDQMPCGIYKFGTKFIASPFVSSDEAACSAFIGEHNGRYPDMWTYTAR